MALSSINPATDQPIRVYEEASSEAVATALSAAAARWRRVPFSRRAEPLRRAGALLRERREDLVLLMTLEMGKPLAQGRAEADKCAWVCEHYAEHAEAFLAAEAVSTEARKSDIAFGGIRDSGYGRELGVFGIREFVSVKTVYVA